MSTLLSFGLSNAVCAALLVLAALLVGRVCRCPALLHSLWLLVLLKLVTPPLCPVIIAYLAEEPAAPRQVTPVPSAEFAVQATLTRIPEVPLIIVHEPAASPQPEPVVRQTASYRIQKPAGETGKSKTARRLETENAFLTWEQAPAAPAPAAVPAAQRPQGFESCVPLLCLAWLAGVIVWLAVAARQVVRFQRLLRHARRASVHIQQQSDALAAQMGLLRPPQVWLLQGPLPPLVWGAIGRARIFFPAKLLARLDDSERASLLAHELAHVRRRDHWVRWLELIASALYWWYPLVWLARRRLHVHEEECCDAWVVGEVPPRVYAGAILNTLDFLAEDRAPLPVMASGLSYVEIVKRRLCLIMEGRTPKRLSGWGRWTLVIVGLLVLSLRPNVARVAGQLARTETTLAQDNEAKAPPTAQSAPAAPAEKSEDAESFLPNPIPLLGNALSVGGVAFSPNGKILAMGAGWGEQASGELRLWDVNKRQMIVIQRGGRAIRNLAFSPDGKHLATAEFDGSVKLRDPESGAVRATLSGHGKGVNFVAFTADSKTLAAAGLDNDISIWDVAEHKQRVRLKGHTDMVLSVAFSPDGKTLASASKDQTAILWDVATGKIRARLGGIGSGVECVAFAPDGKTVATGDWNGQIRVWDSADGKLLLSAQGPGGIIFCLFYSPDGKTLAASGPGANGNVRLLDPVNGNTLEDIETNVPAIYSAAFSLDGKRLAVGSREGMVKLWDVAGHKELATVENRKERLFQPQPVLALVCSPDGKIIAVAGEDGTVQLCELATGIQRFVLKGHDDVVSCLAFSPDGKLLATGSPDLKIKLWDAATGKEVRTLKGHTSWIYALAFSPDGKTLASGSYDRTVRLWDPGTGQSLRILKGHKASIRAVAFRADGKMLASAGSDRTIHLWPVDADGEAVILKGHEDTVRALAFSPDGKTLASGSDDHTIKLWDVENKKERATLKGVHNAEVTTLAFSPHGKTLVSGAAGGGIVVWDPSTGTHRGNLNGHQQNAVTSVLILPDGQRLLSAGLDRTVKIWQAAASPMRLLRGHTGPVIGMAISRDGRRLLSGSGWPQGDRTARLWDLQTGKELRVFRAGMQDGKDGQAPPSQVSAVAFSPDGKQAASAGASGVVFLWDVETGKELRRFRGHAGDVSTVDFAPDGHHLLSGGEDKIIRLWEVKSGRLIRTFEGHTNWVRSVSFGRDGKRFLSGGRDGVMRLWDVDSGKQVRPFAAAPEGATESVMWMPDNRRAVCAGGKSTVQIWDVESGERLRAFTGHQYGVTWVDVSPDGRSILSCGYDWTIRLWDVATGQQRKIFRLQEGFARAAKFSIDGRYALVAGGGRSEGGGKYVPGGTDFPIRMWALGNERAAQR